MTTSRSTTLVSTLFPAHTPSAVLLRSLAVIIVANLLLIASAHVRVPMYPVPMTMQTFAVLAIGLTAGWRLGGAAVLTYLAQGAIGLPVFTGGAGLAYMMGPTGGYLAGFFAAAVIAGWAATQGSIVLKIGGVILANVVLMVIGVAYLSTLIGLEPAIANGLLPFIYGEAVKIGLAIAVALAAARVVRSDSH